MAQAMASNADNRWAERTYEAMASVYDDFTAHHEYDLWTADLIENLSVFGELDLVWAVVVLAHREAFTEAAVGSAGSKGESCWK